jgi:hypothetical protein
MDVEPVQQEHSTPPVRLSAAWLFGALLAGAFGGIGSSQLAQGWLGPGADERSQPPLIILSVADAVMAGRDARQIRALAERLADGGFLVLDEQAVLAAPGELYLPLGEGAGR